MNELAASLRDRFDEEGEAVGQLVVTGLVIGQPVLEMTLEAMCEWHVVDPSGRWLEPVDWVWGVRGWRPGDRLAWSRRPFASHEDALARARGDERISRAFVEETASMLAIDRRDDDGLVYVWDYRRPGPRPLACDYMHEYASRLASAAALGGEPEWFDVAVHQFLGYAEALRDPATGLWHPGRDWGDEPGLSPGAWSRGHGWVVRGLAETLRWLPHDHPGRPALRTLLVQTLESLAPLQDADGMWHTMLDRPWDDSEAEASGTSLIAYGIARAVTDGDLPGDPWADVAARAVAAVCARAREQEIVIHHVDTTPGLGWDEAHLRLPTVLYACLGAALLNGS
jgi:unsaturated rhamnogalacturonyl hydrolase